MPSAHAVSKSLPPVRTYVAGEDAGRMANAASYLGLEQQRLRRPLQPVREAVATFFQDATLTAARMHSVGVLGRDEHIDTSGTLHYVSVRRRQKTQQDYGSLHSLFEIGEKPETYINESNMETMTEIADEEDYFVEDLVEGGSLQAAIVGVVKGTVGPAILYLPHGFQSCGYAVAIPAMIGATATYIYTSHRLLDCWRVESERNHKMAARMEEVRALLDPTNGQGGATPYSLTPSLLTYPELARRALGPKYAFPVYFGISSMQFGVCLTYLIFVPATLYQCCLAIWDTAIPKHYFVLAMLLIEIPLSWIMDIRRLTPTNMLATSLIAYGLFAVIIMAIAQGLQLNGQQIAFQQNIAMLPALTDSWFLFIGTSFFMMEGSITLLVPLQEAVFLPEDKAKFPTVNQITTTWIVIFYIFFSIICVAGFGEGLQTALTASLRGSLASSVQLAYAIAVILTFPLQAFPAMEVTCKAILGDAPKSTSESPEVVNYTRKRRALATMITCLLGLFANFAIDYLGNVVSILGSLFGIPLALIFPPIMHNILVKDSSRKTTILNYTVVVVGFFAMGATSFATFTSWNKGADN